MKQSYSLMVFVLAIAVIWFTADAKGKWRNQDTEATLSWDVMGYYLYLPASIIYKDLSGLKFKDEILKKYRPSGSFYQAYDIGEDRYIMKYSVGLALLMLPFFLIGHLIALLSEAPADGFSWPYQYAIHFGSLLVAFLGLWMSRSLLLRYFSDKVTALTLLLLVIATNYLNYASIDAAMTHNYLFTLIILLVYSSIKWYEKPNYRYSIFIGLLVGFIALTRPTDIVALLIPLCWGLTGFAAIPDRLRLWQTHWKKLLLAIGLVAAVGLIQPLYWRVFGGEWIIYSYEDQGFNWKGVHFVDCLFSYRKGWLVYTPMMVFALLGFPFLFRKNRALFWSCLPFFLISTYIIFSWDIWWYGGSFGQRAIVQSYAILIFPFAACIDFLFRQKIWLQIPIYLLFGFFTWLNLFQTYQIHSPKGGLDPEFMTKAYYWRIFGRTDISHSDKLLMDTDEDHPGERKDIQQIYRQGFETFPASDLVRPDKWHSGKMGAYINADFPKSPELIVPLRKLDAEWVRVNAYCFSEWKEWEMWIMPKLRVAFMQGDQVVKERFIRVSRVLGEKEWQKVWIDTRRPKKAFDKIKIQFDNSGSRQSLWIDDVTVESFASKDH